MKIRSLSVLTADVPLLRPYAVASHATDTARMVRVRIDAEGGEFGLGAAAPQPVVNGETIETCVAGLRAAAARIAGVTFLAPRDLAAALRHWLPEAPGARAAIDIALHDLWGKVRSRPVADLLGRVHTAMPTSVTIGVRDVPATLAEAREYVARGFRVLKVKIGTDLELDVERLVRLRETVGPAMPLLVDANVGYTFAELTAFLGRTRALGIQVVEQPLPRAASSAQRHLPREEVRRLAADESLHGTEDAATLAPAPMPFGVWNIKLMKCGGITAAVAIADAAAEAGIELMWGCMDESVVGIAAALHAAFACKATRYLDLDGSLDLSHDFAAGGFRLEDGVLRTLDRPGLGVEPID